ncbi:MAG TPA: sulfite exporter TauE/SafE family protein [Burkholderiaceae bacterium]|nr:sulfite exporter TauE/SafE family protein [Burkholderiaceae bacterium]
MNLPIETLAGVGLIVAFAYTVVGLTGFGASMVAMPMLVHLLPLRLALPMMLIYDLVGGVAIGVRNRRSVDRRELIRLLPFMLVGVVLGVTVLVKAPERVLLLLLGAFVLAFAGWSLLFRPRQKPIAPGWAVPLGTVGGVFSALFGTGGPIYTIYLARRVQDKSRLRATISMLLFLSALARLASFVAASLFSPPGLPLLIATMLPCALAGMYLGTHLHHRLPAHRVVQAVWAILIVGGATLVLRSL